VNQAALNLVRASNPKDEVFGVNFNDEHYLDQDFTNNLLKLKEALEKIDARGGTALYDAVVASAEHLKRNARLEKKVLLIVTDGEDSASHETLEQADASRSSDRLMRGALLSVTRLLQQLATTATYSAIMLR
jgi:Ca-activated chloride channel family protein